MTLTEEKVLKEIEKHTEGLTYKNLIWRLKANPSAHLTKILDSLYEQKKIRVEVFDVSLPGSRTTYTEQKVYPITA